MRVDLRTLVMIRQRIDHAAIPRLFDDSWSPSRVRRRRDRILSWMSPLANELSLVRLYDAGGAPEPGRRYFTRHGF